MPDARFTSKRFETDDGLSLHYREYAGPRAAALTVICLPGLTRNARDFEALAPRLVARHRVLCLDFRGRGSSQYAPDPMSYVPRSYVRDLHALFDHAGVGEAALVGTSLGGMVATLFAAIYPAKVAGLVLNDVGPEVDPAGLARIAGYVGKAKPIEGWDDAAQAVEQLDRIVYPDYGPGDWLRLARRRFAEGPDGRVRLDYDLDIAKPFGTPATTPEQWPFFRRLRDIPILLIRGELSDILSRATVEKMRAAAPQMKVLEAPGRGHTPSLDEPPVAEAIEAFVAGLPPHLGPARRSTRALSGWAFRPKARRLGVL
jgi:pimeloyl-ACP methyl ester carboxylesterase